MSVVLSDHASARRFRRDGTPAVVYRRTVDGDTRRNAARELREINESRIASVAGPPTPCAALTQDDTLLAQA
ncbi:MAG: hypothetical protein R3E48_16275 [Burkholderiaceae bacterium]